jgi:putative hemolysin
VTETTILLAALIVIFLAAGFTSTAARAALGVNPITRFTPYGEPKESHTTHGLNGSSNAYYRTALELAQGFSHFLLAGTSLLLTLVTFDNAPQPVLILVALAGAALVVLGIEVVIEGRVKRNPDQWNLRLSSFTRLVTYLFYPLLSITGGTSRQLVRSETVLNDLTDEELRSLVDSPPEGGILEQEERKMIYSIFRLGNTLAREIMVPRIDITTLESQATLDQAVDILMETGHSRMPVYEESIDNILGLLYAKDLLPVWREGNQMTSLRELLRPAYFVPEAKKVDELLGEMQSRRIHMAIVVDEYGGVAGLVTLEDIVEEIVGEIQDEYDQAEESPYQELEGGEYIFQGRVDLDDFNEIMGSYLPREEADTIGGFIYNRVGRVPANGENLQVENLLLTVDQVSGRRIRKVRARWAPIGQEDEKEESNANK